MYDQAKALLNLSTVCFPKDLVSAFDTHSVGIGCVLSFLYVSDGAVSSGAISRHMNVSTARVAVLLKNLEEKGLVRRRKDGKDSRITLVELTDAGYALYQKREDALLSFVDSLIERVGYDRLKEFLLAGSEINKAVRDLLENNPEVAHMDE